MSDSLYFAYGSNLNHADWERWRGEQGVMCERFRARGIAYLPDHELTFGYRAPTRNGGVLDVRRRMGQAVAGVIFEVSNDMWATLDRKESAPNCYERYETVAFDTKGNEVPVTTYRVVAKCRERFVRPAKEHVEIVRQGMKEHEIATQAMMSAAEDSVTPPLVEGLFCYGTLMRGECRFHMMDPFGVTSVEAARGVGDLIDLGSFPGLVDVGSSTRRVKGEFVRLEKMAEALEELDRVEGFHGYDCDEECMYRRAIVPVEAGGKTRLAWTYCYAQGWEGRRLIESGSWRTHVGR